MVILQCNVLYCFLYDNLFWHSVFFALIIIELKAFFFFFKFEVLLRIVKKVFGFFFISQQSIKNALKKSFLFHYFFLTLLNCFQGMQKNKLFFCFVVVVVCSFVCRVFHKFSVGYSSVYAFESHC